MTRRITAAEARELVEKATPGPWAVDDSGVEVYVRSAKSVGALAACMYGHPEENARLMAAAPDLAASLIAAEAERAARAFLHALIARRPHVLFSAHYDAMEGIEIIVGTDAYGVSVSLLNCGWAFLGGPRGKMRADQTAKLLADADGLAPLALDRLDLATLHEFDEGAA